MPIIIEKVNYNNTKDIRILETVLTNWFKNPKELNLVEPRMKYPFNFKKWVTLTYNNYLFFFRGKGFSNIAV